MMVRERSYAQLCAVIVINEIEPRARKHGFRPPPKFAALLAGLEHTQTITRKRLRSFLDEYYADVAAGRCQRS